MHSLDLAGLDLLDTARNLRLPCRIDIVSEYSRDQVEYDCGRGIRE